MVKCLSLSSLFPLLLVVVVAQADPNVKIAKQENARLNSAVMKLETAGQKVFKDSGEILRVHVELKDSGEVLGFSLENSLDLSKSDIGFTNTDLSIIFAEQTPMFASCRTEVGCFIQLPSTLISVNNGGVVLFNCKGCSK